VKSGKVKWDGEFVTPRGRNPQASLVWAGERALIFNELGELILARLTPEGFQELGKVSVLKDGTWANPAFADGCIFARNDKEIVCVPLTAKGRLWIGRYEQFFNRSRYGLRWLHWTGGGARTPSTWLACARVRSRPDAGSGRSHRGRYYRRGRDQPGHARCIGANSPGGGPR